MTVYLVLFVAIMVAVYVFVMVEAGSYLHGLLMEDDTEGRTAGPSTSHKHARVHRDA